MLEISHVNTFYGKIQVLWDVSMTINEGEIVALVGANGAGKSTLVKTVSGIVRPTSGSINFCGESIVGLPPHAIVERGICQVPEGGRAFPEMSIRENLEMGAYPRRTWGVKEETFQQVVDIFPRLKERESQLARTLSGGEKQMLAVGRALMSRPKLVMFDELSYGLAPVAVQEVLRVVEALRDQGLTVLLIEQDVRHALAIANRAYVLENGRVCMEGACADLLKSDYVRKAYLGL